MLCEFKVGCIFCFFFFYFTTKVEYNFQHVNYFCFPFNSTICLFFFLFHFITDWSGANDHDRVQRQLSVSSDSKLLDDDIREETRVIMRPKKPPRPKSEVFLNKPDLYPRRKRFSAFGVSFHFFYSIHFFLTVSSSLLLLNMSLQHKECKFLIKQLSEWSFNVCKMQRIMNQHPLKHSNWMNYFSHSLFVLK